MKFQDFQASSMLEMADGTVLTACDQCRMTYAERIPPEAPPCETCRVLLQEENEEAAAVYMATRGQVITRGVDGVVTDISIPAICDVMDRYPGGIKDQWRCMSMVIKTFHSFLKEKRHES